MRKFLFVVSILIAAACSKQQVREHAYVVTPSLPQVIDHPAVIIISPSAPQDSPVPSFRKIMDDYQLPLINSLAGNLEFVKSNGDKVKMDLNLLKSRYDLVLFNGSNNPLPIQFRDLSNAFKEYFHTARPAEAIVPVKEMNIPVAFVPDTNDCKGLSTGKVGNQQGKRVVFHVPDTSSISLPQREIPGISWVEHRVDTRKILLITFENDLITYANTDRYFTNGITLSLQAPWLGNTRLAKLAIPYQHRAVVDYSLHLVQNMYTPTDTRVAPALHNDRPYASLLYLGFRKNIRDAFNGFKLSSELMMGYLGPYSPGSYLQTLVHETFPTNDKPRGWETQIKTAPILNYNLDLEKSLVSSNHVLLSSSASVMAGSLYDRAGVGLHFRAGRVESYFGNKSSTADKDWQYFFFADTRVNCIIYDATLQGGFFSKDEIFRLNPGEISRIAGSGSAGIQVSYRGAGLELAQHYLSPEYKGGLWHKWGRISLLIPLR